MSDFNISWLKCYIPSRWVVQERKNHISRYAKISKMVVMLYIDDVVDYVVDVEHVLLAADVPVAVELIQLIQLQLLLGIREFLPQARLQRQLLLLVIRAGPALPRVGAEQQGCANKSCAGIAIRRRELAVEDPVGL